MSPSFVIACALFLFQTAYGVMQKDEYIPDSWDENMRDRKGLYQYVKDPEDCGFGYICDQNGRILDVYDCKKFDAFFSITFKVCAVASALKAYGEETCDYVIPTDKFRGRQDDPRCNERPNEANADPDNCQNIVLCWDNESLDMLKCQKGTGFLPETQRCENVTPSTVDSVCGNRNMPQEWLAAEN